MAIPPESRSGSGTEPASTIMKRSLVLSLTNPKAILFYVSFFVQFIDVNAEHRYLFPDPRDDA
jgi:threonine/homoserine/homoserine lactone efflux protein